MHEIEILTTDSLGDSSYLLTSGGEAALVDPQRDSWDLLESCARRGMAIRYVLETHVHNDYVSGALEVRAATGATVAGPARAGYDFDHLPLAEDDEIAFGDLTVRAMATPGHTAEHTSYLVFDDAEAPEDVAAVCTGGSLLVGNAGRTDLSGDARTEELARAQYRSLRRLALLPDATRVLPTHGAGSSCAAGPLSRERTTTVGAERRTNPALGLRDEEDFVAERTTDLPPYPAYYHHMAPINRHGPDVLGRLPALRPLTPAMVEGLIGGGARIVDGRDRAAFAAAHLPGSICDELDERFASLVGEVLPFGTRLVLVLPEPAGEAADEAVRQLLRIGFESIAGHLPGGVDTWAAAGRPVRTFRTADAAELAGRLDRTRVLDVRPDRPEGGVPGTLGIPLAELPRRLGELPRDQEIWTVCGSGRRATIAASLLDMAGIRVTAVTRGGVARLPRPA